jgi:hypothetical protein
MPIQNWWMCDHEETDSQTAIEKLMEIFARFGLVEVLVSDGGPALIAEMFKEFMITNIITQISLYQLTGRTYHKNG